MTLLQMLHWMLACGMVVVGLPWGQAMRNSGSYYGATAVGDVTREDLAQARSSLVTSQLERHHRLAEIVAGRTGRPLGRWLAVRKTRRRLHVRLRPALRP